jgi:hypothetical protein
MTQYYSDNFAPAAADVSARAESYLAPVAISNAVLRKKKATVTLSSAVTAVAPDVVHLMKFKSSDRLFDLRISNVGASTTAIADVGVYVVQPDGSGSLTVGGTGDALVFASALSLTGTDIDRADAFLESTRLEGEDRGKQLWELVNLSIAAPGLTEDPKVDYYISLTITTAVTGSNEVISVEADYTAGS